jgi:hypothetical protein
VFFGRESRMNKPRIFLGSSGEQAKLLRAMRTGSQTSPM